MWQRAMHGKGHMHGKGSMHSKGRVCGNGWQGCAWQVGDVWWWGQV